MAVQASESVVSAIMKQVYPGAIEDQLNDEVGPWAVLAKEKRTLAQGQGIIEPMRVQRAQGIGSRGDTDRLPTSTNQGLINATIKMASTYLVGQITGRVIRSSYDTQAAFENVLTEEMRFSMTDFVDDIARQVATGHGRLAKVNGAVTAASTIVVDRVQNLGVGMRVQIFNGAVEQSTPVFNMSANTGGATILTVNPTTNTITVDSNQTLTSGAFLYRAGNFDGTTNKEMNGFETTIDTTTFGVNYFGINRSTYYQTQGAVLDLGGTGAGGVLTEDKVQQAQDAAKAKGGGRVNIWFSDFATRRAYLALLAGQKRYPVDGIQAPSFGGGIKQSADLTQGLAEGLSFNGSPVVVSQKMSPSTMVGLDLSSWVVYQQSDVEWVLNGDSVLHPLLTTGYDAYQFSLFYDAQVYCKAPQRNVKLINTI